MTDFLDFAERNGFALFPMPFGQKAPHGIVASFAHDWSRSPEQWQTWRTQHKCNFGIVAGASRLVIVDIDVAEVGFETAWGYWTEWCTARGLPVFQSYCQSARGGRHIGFQIPADFDISTLRQVPLIGAVEGISKKPIIDLRVGNGFVVAPGSYYDGSIRGEQSGHYVLLPNARVHVAPDALLTACTRAKPKDDAVTRAGTADVGDVEKVLIWMAQNGEFASYAQWCEVGMILRSEFGDDPGFQLWQLTSDGTCSADAEWAKWQSFTADPRSDGVGIGTLRHNAKKAGCPHVIRKSTQAMFAELLPPGAGILPPLPYGLDTAANSLMGNTAAVVADLGRPTVESFIAANQSERPATDAPQIPDAASAH
jgi:hypothetical protein